MYNEMSVIVCTRDRPEHLQKCIASLLRQSVKPKEIIIVDDASREKIDLASTLRDAFSSLKKRVTTLFADGTIKIKYVRNKRRQGVVKSRNLGIAAAKGDVIAFIDDDGYAHKDWIKNLRKHYKNKSVLGVGGPIVEVGRNVEIKTGKRISYITRHGDIKHNYRVRRFKDTRNLRVANVRFLMGGNMSFRRNVLLSLKGFSTEYKGNYYREETDICMRASRAGKIVFEPSAVAYHNTAKHGGTRDIMSMEKFFYWYFRNTVLLFFRHFDLNKALSRTWRQCRKYIKDTRRGVIKTNRDYLIASMSIKIALAIVTGTIAGILLGLLFDQPLKKLVYKHPEYATVITIVLMGATFQIIDYRNIEGIVKHMEEF